MGIKEECNYLMFVQVLKLKKICFVLNVHIVRALKEIKINYENILIPSQHTLFSYITPTYITIVGPSQHTLFSYITPTYITIVGPSQHTLFSYITPTYITIVGPSQYTLFSYITPTYITIAGHYVFKIYITCNFHSFWYSQ